MARHDFPRDGIGAAPNEYGQGQLALLREMTKRIARAAKRPPQPDVPTEPCTCWRGKERSEFLCVTCEDFARKTMARQARMRGLPA